MSFDLETIYSLLPTIYRIKDGEQGELVKDGERVGPLKDLLGVIADQVAVIEENLDHLYDDQFIETCAEWIVPYIGDLLGVRALHTGSGITDYNFRAYIANTIAYRRRKGTAAVLEQLAKDVTQWSARVVEFYQLLALTQHLVHLRPEITNIHLKDENSLDLIGTPFERSTHTAELRRIASGRGRYNIPNVGIYLWRLGTYTVEKVPSHGVNGKYHINPLGADMPLFNQPATEVDITHLAEEINIPGQIRPMALRDDLKSGQNNQGMPDSISKRGGSYYGSGRSLAVYINDNPQPEPGSKFVVADLNDWCPPKDGRIAIDPERGRLTFPTAEIPTSLEVTHTYGFSADMGGGPYDRSTSLVRTGSGDLELRLGGDSAFQSLGDARDEWIDQGMPDCIIWIDDNQIYDAELSFSLPAKTSLVIQARDGMRPILQTGTDLVVDGPEDAAFILNGIWMEGGIKVSGGLGITLTHSTLVPGREFDQDGSPRHPELPSLYTQDAHDHPTVAITHCILGPVWLPDDAGALIVEDSIIIAYPADGSQTPAISGSGDGTQPGPASRLARVTVFGPIHIKELGATEVIFKDMVTVVRRQKGCLRFSYAPLKSQTPRRYRCQPDSALKAYAQAKNKTIKDLSDPEVQCISHQVRPRFTSQVYGSPFFGQLGQSCHPAIRTGGEDGSEMGAFNLLMQPQRETNLRGALREYLKYGLEAGIFYVT